MERKRDLLTGLINTRRLLMDYVFPFSEDAEAVLTDAIKRLTPEEIEREGGGYNWWHICPECHGAVESGDHYCIHCGQALKNGKI